MITFTVDTAARTRITTFTGVVTDVELLGAYRGLVADPSFDQTLNDLVDLSGIERLEVSAGAINRLAELFAPLDRPELSTRCAIVAPTDYVFGMARMYQSLRSDAPEDVCVFRNMAEARFWLGIDPK